MKRFPNTKHWQRLVSACRHTHRSRWRTTAARLVGCNRSDLRALIDRIDLHPAAIKGIDQLLIDHLQQYAVFLRDRAEDASNLAKDVMRATGEISVYAAVEVPVDFDDDAGIATAELSPTQSFIRATLEDLMEVA
jgi:hypothetical protein